jgi:hypothetical protein
MYLQCACDPTVGVLRISPPRRHPCGIRADPRAALLPLSPPPSPAPATVTAAACAALLWAPHCRHSAPLPQAYAAERLFMVLRAKRVHMTAVNVGGYILGEFGFFIAEQVGFLILLVLLEV